MQDEATGLAGDSSGPVKKGWRKASVVATGSPSSMRAAQRAKLIALAWTASQAALVGERPEGRWFSPTPPS